MHYTHIGLALGALLMLSACGETRTQRVATGALAGGAIGQIADDRALEGAAVGGILGAVR